jgi:hypothetical protein
VKQTTSLDATTIPLIFYIHYWQLAIFISMVLSAVAKTYLLTSFGRAVGFFSDLAMCMALAWVL